MNVKEGMVVEGVTVELGDNENRGTYYEFDMVPSIIDYK